MGNVAITAFFLLFNFVSYVAVGNYGILVGVAAVIITSSRLFDGITDPFVAWLIDKTDSKFSRYRPMMLLGYAIATVAIILMDFLCIGGGVIIFILLYAL